VPLPWSGQHPPFGFSPFTGVAAADPWLPQPEGWSRYTVESQAHDPRSMLSLYLAALALRRSEPALGDGTLEWLDSGPGVLAFSRGGGFVSVTNLSDGPIDLPEHEDLLLSSTELTVSGQLAPDSTAWLRTQH
jgi:alpha-glucosidase